MARYDSQLARGEMRLVAFLWHQARCASEKNSSEDFSKAGLPAKLLSFAGKN
jgi:hypothetical protein